MIQGRCVFCDTPFVAPKTPVERLYCGQRCRRAAYEQRDKMRKCPECGRAFAGRRNRVYCRRRCQSRATNRQWREHKEAHELALAEVALAQLDLKSLPLEPLEIPTECACGAPLVTGTDGEGRLVDWCANCGPQRVKARMIARPPETRWDTRQRLEAELALVVGIASRWLPPARKRAA